MYPLLGGVNLKGECDMSKKEIIKELKEFIEEINDASKILRRKYGLREARAYISEVFMDLCFDIVHLDLEGEIAIKRDFSGTRIILECSEEVDE